jgi:hypothetical protein
MIIYEKERVIFFLILFNCNMCVLKYFPLSKSMRKEKCYVSKEGKFKKYIYIYFISLLHRRSADENAKISSIS